ncbi:MAG TPA: hypothetical protein VMS60_05800 [Solirubrobacterales bacterium]|nr:hypothetical protein [Solirubrobacterales bacterium]
MATENPTGDGCVVSLTIPAGNKAFLRRVISAARDGLREELERFGDRLNEPRSSLLLEETAYVSLLDALDRSRVIPDDELRGVLARLAESVDHENEYARVAFEHDALRGLLAQIEAVA